jgi:hypothetical protein
MPVVTLCPARSDPVRRPFLRSGARPLADAESPRKRGGGAHTAAGLFLGASVLCLPVSAAMAGQSAREIRGASPYDTIDNEPPPRLIVDPPLAEPLKLGIFQAQYRVENLRIVNVFGPAAVHVSPRIGHLHVIVDDLPWWWADASDNNTVDIANLPPGAHKVTIELVSPNHDVYPGQTKVLHFTVPPRDMSRDGH